jgi:hypothetical protein
VSPYKNQKTKLAYSRKKPLKGLHRGDTAAAKMLFENRSQRSQTQDLLRLAPIAPNIEVYMAAPNRYDWPGVDVPDPALIFSHKTRREQASDLAKLAGKAPLEIWIEHTNRYDFDNIDTPRGGKAVPLVEQKTAVTKTVRRFHILKKKIAEPAREEPTRKMPSKAEIEQHAREIFMEEQAKTGLPSITPEVSELREAGLIQKAQAELMRSETTVADSQVEQYIHDLGAELEPLGYAIVQKEVIK